MKQVYQLARFLKEHLPITLILNAGSIGKKGKWAYDCENTVGILITELVKKSLQRT